MPEHKNGVPGSCSAAALAFMRAHRGKPTLSVYANREPEDRAGRDALRLELQHAFDAARSELEGAPKTTRAAFDDSVHLARTALKPTNEAARAPASATFVSSDGGVLVEALATRVDTAVTWRPGARIVPLLEAAIPPEALVALVDSEHSRIFRLAGDALVPLEAHEDHPVIEPARHMGATPRGGFHVGTRGETQTDAVERVHREAQARHAHRTAARISALAGGASDVIVGGAAASVRLVLASLPIAVRCRTTSADSLQLNSGGSEIARITRAAQRVLVAGRQRTLLRDLLNDARHAHRSAIGLPEVSDAAGTGAVDHLLVSRALARAQPDAVEAAIAGVLHGGGIAEVVDGEPGAALDANAHGIAARLRFAPPANHRVAEPSIEMQLNA